MAFSEIYVDPSIAADSGTGTVGDPFGDLEYAIEQTTFDTTNGTRINVKAGTAEVLALEMGLAFKSIVTTPAWVTSFAAQIIIQGYTTAAGDGGMGSISGGGLVPILQDNQIDYVWFVDMVLHTIGSGGYIALVDNWCGFVNCELHGSTGTGAKGGVSCDASTIFVGCYFHDIAAWGINTGGACYVTNCYFKDGAVNKFAIALDIRSTDVAVNNVIDFDQTGTGIGIHLDGDFANVNNNSIFNAAAGTGSGIKIASTDGPSSILNNIVEGFSGAGGIGFNFGEAGARIGVYGGNAAYNNTTNYVAPSGVGHQLGGSASNEALSASPFADAAAGDFSPVDTGSVKEGSLPQDFGGGV